MLAAQYESFILPLAVILSLPVGVFGSFLLLKLLGLANDVYAQIGLVMLVGLLGQERDADRRVRRAEAPRRARRCREAAIEGAKVRFRPILMTSFAFIAGLIPLGRRHGAGAIGNRTIGASALGGMLFGTVFGVLVMPGLYFIFGTLAEGRSSDQRRRRRTPDRGRGTTMSRARIVTRRGRDSRVLCSLGVGCVPSLKGNEPREPNKKVPASFGVERVARQTTSAAQKKWSEFFSSPELRALIDGALKNNRELNIQLQEIIIAQNEVSARQGEYLPKVSAGAGAGVEKVGTYTSQGASDEAHGLPREPGELRASASTGSWEVDVWKKLRNAAKAAGMRYLASIEAKNFMVDAARRGDRQVLLRADRARQSARGPEAEHRDPDGRAGGRQARRSRPPA